MDVIYLFGTVQAFFLSFLIFTKRNKSTGDYVLGSWMAFIGVHLVNQYLHSTGLIWEYPHLLGIGTFFPTLEGPFMFVYVLVLINKSGRFKMVYLLHGLPFILINLFLLYDYYFLPSSEKIAYFKLHTSPLELTSIEKMIYSLNVFLGPVYIIWSLFKLRKHSKNITEQFSYTEYINLNWLKYVIAALGFVWITVLLSTILSIFSDVISVSWGNRLIYLTVTVVVFFLGYFGLKQKAIYVDFSNQKETKDEIEEQKEAAPKERYKKSGLSDKKAKEYIEKLLQLMDKEKLYLDGQLSLKDVAALLNISTNHLSQVINGHMGVTFFDFVNKYRVDEIKKRLSKQENEQFTLLAIAYDCGFNSKSSFNKIFKNTTGCTPSEYLKTSIS